MAGRHHREAMSSRRPRWAREQAPETASSNSLLDDPPLTPMADDSPPSVTPAGPSPVRGANRLAPLSDSADSHPSS